MGIVRDIGGMGGDIVNGITGQTAADAAESAADKQYNASLAGIEFQRDALEQQRNDLKPFRNLATTGGLNAFRNMAVNQENYAYNPNNDALLNNALNRTTRAVMDAQAARGKLGSGSTLTSLTEAMAPIYMNRQQQVFDNRYNANNQQFNQLAQLIGMAQNAAAGQGAATQNATNNITSLTTQGANAQAAGQIGAANAQQQGINNLIGLGAMAFGMSDIRAKENVQVVGHDEDGLDIIEYNYIGQPERWRGYSAQQVRNFAPEFVAENDDGYLMVTGKYLPKRVA